MPADMAIIPCAEWDSLHLAPPPRGAFYGYVDQDLLLIAEAGHEILDTIVLADAAITAAVP